MRNQIDEKKGLHYKYTKLENKLCFDCHNDHAGRDFELIHWEKPMKEFDHELTGYSLIGKHKSILCRDCHNPALISNELLQIEPELDITKTLLGLTQGCLNCHLDEHRTQLGNDCLKCHSQNRWVKAELFAHDKSKFVLTGKHKKVDCQKCHKTITEDKPVSKKDISYSKYIGLKFNNCTSCHTDIHKGKFGNDCNRCHVTEGWKILDERNVDHNKTDFPLMGKHKSVKCDVCHKPNKKFKKNQYNECLDCHNDYHLKQFAKRADKGKCESCHTVDGFKPAIFPISSHNETEFKLTGAHLAQPCFVCHKLTESVKPIIDFKPKERLCIDCHIDRHLGQFSKTKSCTDCHNESDWRESLFNHETGSSYKLLGAHKKVDCSGCHKESVNGTEKYILYKPLESKCESCHQSDVKPLE